MNLKSANKKHTSNSDVHESNLRCEDEEQIGRSLVNLKSLARWLEPWPWHNFDKDGREGGGYNSFSRRGRWLTRKAMETLTHNGAFIRFSTKLKWLEPTKGLSHLI